MKKLALFLTGILGFAVTSCGDDDPAINIYPGEHVTVAPVLEIPATTDYVILQDQNEDTQETFTWTAAESSYNGALTYYVELAPAGSDFANAVNVLPAAVSTTNITFTYADLNAAMNRLNTVLVNNGLDGVTFNEAYAVDFRVKAISGASLNTTHSTPISATVNAYPSEFVPTPELFLVGAVQAYYGIGAWSPENAMPMRYTGDGTTKVFEAYVKVNAGDGFKFVDELSWNGGNYGTIGGAQDGNIENSGGSGDVKIAETDGPGLYYIRVDLDALTYQAVKMNWGVIGEAVGSWDIETPMAYNFADNVFTLTVNANAGGMKFRCSNAGEFMGIGAWGFNIGASDPATAWDTNAPNITAPSGTLDLTLSIAVDGIATYTGI